MSLSWPWSWLEFHSVRAGTDNRFRAKAVSLCVSEGIPKNSGSWISACNHQHHRQAAERRGQRRQQRYGCGATSLIRTPPPELCGCGARSANGGTRIRSARVEAVRSAAAFSLIRLSRCYRTAGNLRCYKKLRRDRFCSAIAPASKGEPLPVSATCALNSETKVECDISPRGRTRVV